MKRDSSKDASQVAETVRVQRLREDARRSLSDNLAEGIALSHKLIRFSNTLHKS